MAFVSVNMFCEFIMSCFVDVESVVFVYVVMMLVRKESNNPSWVVKMEMFKGMATLMLVIPVLSFPRLSNMT